MRQKSVFNNEDLKLVKAHEDLLKPNIFALHKIFSNKHDYSKPEYTGLYDILYGADLKYNSVGVFDSDEKQKLKVDVFTHEGFLTTSITAINFDKLKTTVKEYLGKNDYKAAVCLALRIQFFVSRAERIEDLKILANLYNVGSKTFTQDEKLGRLLSESAKKEQDEQDSIKKHENLSSEIARLQKIYNHQDMNDACNRIKNLDFYKILGVKVEDCMDKSVLNNQYILRKDFYQKQLSELDEKYKLLLKDHDEKSLEALLVLQNNLKTIIKQIDAAYTGLADSYTNFYPPVKPLTNANQDIKQKTDSIYWDLQSEINTFKKEIETLREKVSEYPKASNAGKIRTMRENNNFKTKMIHLILSIKKYEMELMERAELKTMPLADLYWKAKGTMRMLVLRDKIYEQFIEPLYIQIGKPYIDSAQNSKFIIHWGGETFTGTLSNHDISVDKEITKSEVKVVPSADNLENSFSKLVNNQLERHEREYEQLFHKLRSLIESNIKAYEAEMIKDQKTMDKNRIHSILELRCTSQKLKNHTLPPSVKLSELLENLSKQRDVIHTAHLHPEYNAHFSPHIIPETGWWTRFLKSFTSFSYSKLEGQYQSAIDQFLNKLNTQNIHVSGIDFRCALKNDDEEYIERKTDLNTVVSSQTTLMTRLTSLLDNYSDGFFTWRHHKEEAQQLKADINGKSQEEIRQQINQTYVKLKNSDALKSNGLFAHTLRYSLEVLDSDMKLKPL